MPHDRDATHLWDVVTVNTGEVEVLLSLEGIVVITGLRAVHRLVCVATLLPFLVVVGIVVVNALAGGDVVLCGLVVVVAYIVVA